MSSKQQKVIVQIIGADEAELRRVEIVETSEFVAQGTRKPEHLAQAVIDGFHDIDETVIVREGMPVGMNKVSIVVTDANGALLKRADVIELSELALYGARTQKHLVGGVMTALESIDPEHVQVDPQQPRE